MPSSSMETAPIPRFGVTPNTLVFYGVFLNGSTSYSDVSNNRIQSNATGIVDHGGFNGFSGNTITDNSGDGIYTNGAFANISGNTISENLQDGVELNGMRSAVSSNSIRFNSIEGILVRGSQNTINNNDLTQNYGGSVEVLGGDRNTISQNSIFASKGIDLEQGGNDMIAAPKVVSATTKNGQVTITFVAPAIRPPSDGILHLTTRSNRCW